MLIPFLLYGYMQVSSKGFFDGLYHNPAGIAIMTVCLGLYQDGLVHISQMTERYIKHPLEVVSVGDIVDVQVMSVDLNKKRIQLTMKIDHSK